MQNSELSNHLFCNHLSTVQKYSSSEDSCMWLRDMDFPFSHSPELFCVELEQLMLVTMCWWHFGCSLIPPLFTSTEEEKKISFSALQCSKNGISKILAMLTAEE